MAAVRQPIHSGDADNPKFEEPTSGSFNGRDVRFRRRLSAQG